MIAIVKSRISRSRSVILLDDTRHGTDSHHLIWISDVIVDQWITLDVRVVGEYGQSDEAEYHVDDKDCRNVYQQRSVLIMLSFYHCEAFYS